MKRIDGTLFLHYPCFDGLVSGALAWDYLEKQCGWKIDDIRFVNYDVRSTWLQTPLPQHSAVVDFLYHPEAEFWADHHGSTFLNDSAKANFDGARHGRTLMYDSHCASCAMLLRDNLSALNFGSDHFDRLAYWANRIDAAVYDSVEEAVFGLNNPSAAINLSLTYNADAQYGEMLLRALRKAELEQIALFPEVQMRLAEVRSKTKLGVDLLRTSIHLESGDIAVSDFEVRRDISVNRYAPYLYFPRARYSVTLTRSESGPKITAMRNPWMDFESIDLGRIFSAYGGGGHQRVGSVLLKSDNSNDAGLVLNSIVEEIRHSAIDSSAARVIA
jgi:hypothetical protein